MFKCLGWLCPATFIFCFLRHQSWHFGLPALRNTCCGNACFGAQVISKYRTWYNKKVILQFMSVGSLAGVTYLHYTVLMSSKKSETALHCCDPALSVLFMLVFRNVFRVVSALQSFAFIPGNEVAKWVDYNSPLWKRVIAWERSRAASGYGMIWFYQLSWQCKLATVKRFESWRFER